MSILKEFDKGQKEKIIAVFVISFICVLSALIYDYGLKEERMSKLSRPEAYEAEKEVSFLIEADNGGEVKRWKYEGRIGMKKLTEAEIEAYISSAFKKVEEKLTLTDCKITGKFELITGVSENPAAISWSFEPEGLISEDGETDVETVRDETAVKATVKVSVGEKEEERKYDLILIPPERDSEEVMKYEVENGLTGLLSEGENKSVSLPEKIGGYSTRFMLPVNELAPKAAGFSILTLAALVMLLKEENKKKVIKRETELREGYAYFTGRFSVLLGAGLNLSAIWRKLDAEESFNESLNHEISITVWELGNGKTEREAYENFGKRIGGMQYPKFSSILAENIKMGSGQILKRLEEEAKEAMEERKNNAKIKGETADTKLLLPMLLQLCLVMLIIMLPAMMSM